MKPELLSEFDMTVLRLFEENSMRPCFHSECEVRRLARMCEGDYEPMMWQSCFFVSYSMGKNGNDPLRTDSANRTART